MKTARAPMIWRKTRPILRRPVIFWAWMPLGCHAVLIGRGTAMMQRVLFWIPTQQRINDHRSGVRNYGGCIG